MASTALATAMEAASTAVMSAARSTTRSGRPVSVATGIVVSAGLAQKTAKVRVGGEEWNKKVRKYFKKPEQHLVHDPNNSLRTGDVVEIVSGWRTSKRKRFVVNRIVAPFGPPIEERPPVPTPEEREAEHAAWRAKKTARKALREQAEAVQRRVAKAERLTEEITRLAWKMRLVDRPDWTAPGPRQESSSSTT